VASNDIELFQSFCIRYINRAVKEHFRDVEGDDDDSLSRAVPRQLIKRICLHKDKDPITLTIGRLLIWWVEAKGLFDEYIYGIPSTDFEIKYTYYPQVQLHFREDRYDAADNDRIPIRSAISFRWREEDYSQANITSLKNKIKSDFVNPPFSFDRGRECWTYWDDQKGYRFTVYVQSETEAKKIIEQVIGIQDTGTPDWDNKLREHKDNVNYTTPGTVRVMGETRRKPRKRLVGTVKFAYAELFIPGVTKPIVLIDRTGNKNGALEYA
jgi:hypothetical protein